MTIRDNKDYIKALLYSYYTTITGWGGPPKGYVAKGTFVYNILICRDVWEHVCLHRFSGLRSRLSGLEFCWGCIGFFCLYRVITKASLNFRPGPALLICTKGVWGRGNPQKWSSLAVFRGPDPAAGGFWGGLLSVLGVTRGLFMCGFGVLFRVPWRPFRTPDGRFLGTLEAVLGHAEAVRFMKNARASMHPA